jgi:hypothetical protein
MSLVSYFLAKNQDVQEQLFREVTDAIAQNGGNPHLDYNTVQSLPYLDQVRNILLMTLLCSKFECVFRQTNYSMRCLM